MPQPLVEYDHFIHQEMLAHPALFIHPKASSVAIIGDDTNGIATEVLKHPTVKLVSQMTTMPVTQAIKDPRLQIYTGKQTEWLASIKPASLDLIIISDKITDAGLYQKYFDVLQLEGLLIQQSESPFDLSHLKSLSEKLQGVGFGDSQILHYPQPNFPSGWRAAMMACKSAGFKRIREKDIFNKPFVTRYYNFDVHKAASVMPEFMREALTVL